MAFTELNPPSLSGRPELEDTNNIWQRARYGQTFGEHNGLFHLIDLQNNQPYRPQSLSDMERNNRPNSYSLRHSLWQAGVVFPLAGTVAIEGNTVKSGGAIRPDSGFLYPRCY